MKKVIVITLAVILVLTLGTGLALAEGPAEKATGTVGLAVTGWPGWYADFNAHEVMDDEEPLLGKGSMRMWNDEIGEVRELRYDVKYVLVEGDEAWFAVVCNWDSWGTFVGQWFFVKVQDTETPGSKGDRMGWDRIKGVVDPEGTAKGMVEDKLEPVNWWYVTDGNLVVHTN